MSAKVSHAGMNESSLDRSARAVGAVIATMSIAACPSKLGKLVSLGLAGFLGATALTGTCPVYKRLGISTAE